MRVPRRFSMTTTCRVARPAMSFALVLAVLPGAIVAQSSTRQEDDSLVFRIDPIVVTATRGPRAASRTPRPVSVVQHRDIVQELPNTVSDLFRRLPGVDVAGVGVNQGRPQIRGQRGQRILILSDGLRLNNSRRQQDFGELPALVDVNGVDHVEIVRGPASVLYGSDAIGGVINIINRVPRVAGLHGTGSFRYGGVENQKSGSFRTYGRFGGFTVRAGGTIREADAYEAPSGSYGGITLADGAMVNGSGTRDQSFDARFGYETGRHSVFGKFERYHAEDSGFGSIDPTLYGSKAPDIRITYPTQTFDKFSVGYRGRELGFALADQFELLAYGLQNDRQLQFGIGPFGIGPGMSMQIENLNTTGIRSYGMRAEARKLAVPGLLFTYGLDLWLDRAEGTDEGKTILTGIAPSPIEKLDNTPQLPTASYLSVGAFMQAEIEATDRLSFVGGARWQRVNAETFATAGLEDQTPVDITDATVVAAVNSIFELTDRVSLVGSVGRAFRSPNLIERFFNGPTPEGSGYQIRNPELGPERSLNVDLGVRYNAGNVALEAFAFRNKISDGIRIRALDYEIGGFQAFENTNIDELLFRGLELSANVGLGRGFSVASGFTWMDAKDVHDAQNPVGESFATKLTGTLHFQDPADRFWASYDVRHNGNQKDVDFGDSNPVGAFMPAFTVMNLRGGVRVWQSDSGMTHSLNIALTNLTNELYAEFSNVGFFRPEPKRNLTLTWEVSF
jgi:hemoglobin/transferrin/lactoferrin receptor protein